jgi:hypothetical protein
MVKNLLAVALSGFNNEWSSLTFGQFFRGARARQKL